MVISKPPFCPKLLCYCVNAADKFDNSLAISIIICTFAQPIKPR